MAARGTGGVVVWAALACGVLGAAAQEASLSNGPFAVRVAAGLEVRLRGEVLIADDAMTYGEDGREGRVQAGREGTTAVLNVLDDGGESLQYRKEVALHEDGRLELTVRMRLLPYRQVAEQPVIGYSFRVPLSRLAGATFTARTGRAKSAAPATGTLTAATPDGSLTAGKCRFIAFERDGLRVVFDANPHGVLSKQDYSMYGEPVGSWNVEKQGDWVVFSFGATAWSYGGIFTSKMILYEGADDYDAKHPYDQWNYHGPTPAAAQFTFGTAAEIEGFHRADDRVYSAAQGWGWRRADGLEVFRVPSPGILDNAVAGRSGTAGEFLVDVHPGVWLLTLRLGHPSQAVGPFAVSLNGTPVLPAVSLSAGETREVSLSHYVRAPERQLVIGLSGPGSWAVHSLIVHPVIYDNQDFALDRGLWVVPGLFDPDVPLDWCGAPPAPAPALSWPLAVTAGTWSRQPAGAEVRAAVRSQPEVMLPADSAALAWRYDARMGGLTGGCGCLLYELYSPELIGRRLDELVAGGMNTVLVSGLHMHHCFLDRWPRIVAYIRAVTELAHARGLKVIYHHDVPVVLYNGTGLQHLLTHTDWLARDVRFGRPTLRSYCIMNPGFRAEYMARIVGLARDTGIDGGMLDEGNVAGDDFCGCEHCRAAFTGDTGLVLPRDHTATAFGDTDDPLWIAWINWRRRAVGDFWVALRRELNAVNPEFCQMKYTTHTGFSTNWAIRAFGADLIDCARGCDFLGTEIMSRNVYDSARAVFAFRKLKSALGDHYGLPIWGLVYHVGDPVFAYVGWAMNQMNRQTTWMSTIDGEDMTRYLDWPGRVDCRRARSVADIAVLFSAQSRDWAKMFGHAADVLGVSQVLTEAHVLHDVILDQDLVDKGLLNRYKLLILASSSCLSARQVEAVRGYVAEGGAVLATANAGLLNEVGLPQETFQLADVFGVDVLPAGTARGPVTCRDREGEGSFVHPAGVLRVKAREGATVRSDVLDAKGNPAWPAVVSNAVGRGRSLYVAMAIGAANYQTEGRAGAPSSFEPNAALAERLLAMIRSTASVPLDFQAVAVPSRVMISACREGDAAGGELQIHLLNATGTGVAKGEVVPTQRDWQATPAFPPVAADLVFEVREPGLRQGHIASPDYAGERPVRVEPLDDGRVRVTVAAADLVAYAIVRLGGE